MFITEIKELVDNYEGKKSHFLLKLENETVHLKCDEAAEKDRWVQAITRLRTIYQGKKVFDFEDDRKSHKDEIDVRILNMIMDEQEGNPGLTRRVLQRDRLQAELRPHPQSQRSQECL